MYRRIINLSKSRSFFLFGARGTGKTTLLTRQIDLKNAVIFSLLDPLLEDELRQNPMALKQKIEAMIPAPKQVIVDEIQTKNQFRKIWRINLQFACGKLSANFFCRRDRQGHSTPKTNHGY